MGLLQKGYRKRESRTLTHRRLRFRISALRYLVRRPSIEDLCCSLFYAAFQEYIAMKWHQIRLIKGARQIYTTSFEHVFRKMGESKC